VSQIKHVLKIDWKTLKSEVVLEEYSIFIDFFFVVINIRIGGLLESFKHN